MEYKYICLNCGELINDKVCPYCNNVSALNEIKVDVDMARMAVRYGYEYRKLANVVKSNNTPNLHFCIFQPDEILIQLAQIVLSGVAWDLIKILAQKLYEKIKQKRKISNNAQKIFEENQSLSEFCTYIKDFQNGLIGLDRFEYEYIEEEMYADFMAELYSDLYKKENRMPTIEEIKVFYNKTQQKISNIVKRKDEIISKSPNDENGTSNK